MGSRRRIIVRLSDGLGNQMYQYAVGLALADHGGGRVLMEDGQLRHNPLRRYGLGAFGLPQEFVGPVRRGFMDLLNRRGFRRAAKLGLQMSGWEFVVDREQGYDPTLFNNAGNVVLSGYWQSYRYLEPVEQQVRAAFAFRAPPDAANAACLARIAS